MSQRIPTEVFTARPSQYREVSIALAKAFADDPVMAYIFPKAEDRVSRIAGIMRMGIRNYGAYGRVEYIGNISAAAVWQQPEAPKPTFFDQLVDAMEGIVKLRGSMIRAATVQQLLAKNRLQQPHWYLAILGTVPQWQGKSLGGRLLESQLRECDKYAIPAYLESSNMANVPFYQRHGFVVRKEIQLPEGPIMRTMLRNPAS
jgi:GNAT superfamily N-acetyltransferase